MLYRGLGETDRFHCQGLGGSMDAPMRGGTPHPTESDARESYTLPPGFAWRGGTPHLQSNAQRLTRVPRE